VDAHRAFGCTPYFFLFQSSFSKLFSRYTLQFVLFHQTLAGRFFKHTPFWLKVHRASMMLVFSTSIPLAATAFAALDSMNPAVMHHRIGLALSVSVLVQVGMGYLASYFVVAQSRMAIAMFFNNFSAFMQLFQQTCMQKV
jgi:hypothetical protein